ncbi:hypothetical protein niasHT_029451 [Heterodera trifolii]|uniref:Uncharacterized protein n=1 Tax=Heterodera trifolii TaxID=157864 RepID=A0ABD2KR33_9BILA
MVTLASASMRFKRNTCTCENGQLTAACIMGGPLYNGSTIILVPDSKGSVCKNVDGCVYVNGKLENAAFGCVVVCPAAADGGVVNACGGINFVINSQTYCVTNTQCPI